MDGHDDGAIDDVYHEVYRQSVDDPEAFWRARADAIDWQTPFARVLDDARAPLLRWFVGGTTNLCHNAVDRHLATRASQLALIHVSTETGSERTYTYRDLFEARCCDARCRPSAKDAIRAT